MLEKVENLIDVNMAVESITITLKTVAVVAGVTMLLLMASILKDTSCLTYQPKHAKSVQQQMLEEQHEVAVKELFDEVNYEK